MGPNDLEVQDHPFKTDPEWRGGGGSEGGVWIRGSPEVTLFVLNAHRVRLEALVRAPRPNGAALRVQVLGHVTKYYLKM